MTEQDSTRADQRPYHHGDLSRILLHEAVRAIEESGAAALSLRLVARRAGVSHAAPAHHFGDKTGLLTAVAIEGYQQLEFELSQVAEETGSFLEVGVAYVRFALDNKGFFEVMFQPELFDANDPDLIEARALTSRTLYGPLSTPGAGDVSTDALWAGVAAWSLVHGFATLWLNRVVPSGLGEDPEQAARAVLSSIFKPLPGASGT
ncbi:MAG: TetR/AcrR family transcriptional regulator [Nitrolancea sp.]